MSSSKGKKSFFELEEFTSIAVNECGVDEKHISLLLRFLHEMGMCMYNEDSRLKDLVIMDAVDYLVKPATMIICNHGGDQDDKTRHVLPKHITDEVAKLSNSKKFDDLVKKGILKKSLLFVLWQDYLSEMDRLLTLMIRYGLIVQLIAEDTQESDVQYLVSSLLPRCKDPQITSLQGTSWGNETCAHSCYFFFTLIADLEKETMLTKADVTDKGFCPSGLYARVLGKTIMWAQETSLDGCWNANDVALFKDVSVLSFGKRCFRLTHVPGLNSLRIDVQGTNPLVIVQKVYEFIEEVLSECMRNLRVMMLLPRLKSASENNYFDALESIETNTTTGVHDDASVLIPLTAVKNAVQSSTDLKYRGKKILSYDALREFYHEWLQVYDMKERYDLFISYRWNDYDKPIARQIFDAMSNYTHGSAVIHVFLDVFRLRDGQRFDEEFASALIKTTVVMPLFSIDALERMFKHDKRYPDNVLLEWIMANECLEASNSGSVTTNVKTIYPIFFGERVKNATTGDIFVREINFAKLSNDLPAKLNLYRRESCLGEKRDATIKSLY